MWGPRLAWLTSLVGLVNAGCGDRLDGSASSDLGADATLQKDTAWPDAADRESDAGEVDSGVVAVIGTGATEVTVEPQTVLTLNAGARGGEGAYAYEWQVSQPRGSVSIFHPSRFVASPTFEVNVAGTYVFELVVTDRSGQRSEPVYFTARVISSAGLHIELLWRTPGDPDESDEGGDGMYHSAGSDMDLHLKFGGDTVNFFDDQHDCYFATSNLSLTSWPEEPQPMRLDRDDTDGGGPENINVDQPVDGIYDVGVHYWNDWGYGAAFATVRIYMDGELAAEWSDVELTNQVMWTPFRIEYPGGAITEIFGRDGGPNLQHPYPVPAIP